jgi:ABC-type Zn uptake system ZnuABC Zn-binding protein ZnuA
MKMKKIYVISIILTFGIFMSVFAQNKINVVTTLTTYADIVRIIGGDKVEVKAIVAGDQDAHYVPPKPSFAVWLSKADMFVETGLDLELWAPVVIDKSGNPRIRSGQPGYVAVADGVKMLEVPVSADRSQGDVHIYGNPHIHTSPLNAKIIAENIAIGLSKINPENIRFFQANLNQFKLEIDTRIFGEKLVQILGGEALMQLALSDKLISFLETQSFKEDKLINLLDGWMKQMLPMRGKKIVAYHKNWIYFQKLFAIEVIGHVEPKPGIPPSPKHVEDLLKQMKQYNVKIIFAANYFDERKIKEIAQKIGGKEVIVPLSVTDDPETSSYVKLVEYWIKQLRTAFQDMTGGA